MDAVTRIAVDTNVFVYRVESEPSDKTVQAATVIDALRGRLVVPVQVLAETSRVLLARRRPPLPPSVVRTYVGSIREAAVVLVPLTPDVVDEAIRGVEVYELSYYDAQVWAAAKSAGAAVLLTEDFQDGQDVEGVRFVNPFAEAFDLAAL